LVHGHHGYETRCVKKCTNIHISTSSFSYLGDVGRHNHPILGPNVSVSDPHRITPFLTSQGVPDGDHHGLVHAPLISGWAMNLIPFVTTHPHNTILSTFGSLKIDFIGGHQSRYYSRISTLNSEFLIGSWPSRL
jgi:hypothetical protein